MHPAPVTSVLLH